MAKAIWNGMVLAESNETIMLEGNHYFPPESLNQAVFQDSNYKTTCPYKGQASYFSVEAGGQVNRDAAWYYPTPMTGYQKIQNYVAFWRGVKVEG